MNKLNHLAWASGSSLEAYVWLIDTNFYLFFGEEWLEWYKRYHPDIHTCEGNTTCEVFEWEDWGGLCCMWVRDITFIAGVVHELLHITEFVDDYFGFHSEEFRAYLIQYLTQAFITKQILDDNTWE